MYLGWKSARPVRVEEIPTSDPGIFSPYPQEFSRLHSPVNGFLKNAISTPNLGIFLRPPLLDPKSSGKPKLNQEWIYRKWKWKFETIVNLGKSRANEKKITCKPNACTMHSNPSKEITHANCYVQNIPIVDAPPIFSLLSLAFLFLLVSKCLFSLLLELCLWKRSKSKLLNLSIVS